MSEIDSNLDNEELGKITYHNLKFSVWLWKWSCR